MVFQMEDTTMLHMPLRVESGHERAPIRILIIAEQRLFRESLVSLLSTEPRLMVVGCVADGDEALELAHCFSPDVVLLDVKTPRIYSITTLRHLKAELPLTRVVFLTAFNADSYALDALAAGADGYLLLKETSAIGLISTIHAVHAGEQVTAPSIASRMMRMLDLHHDSTHNPDNLSVREMETLILIARGMIAREVARTLAISEKTVRNHISSIYRKLNIYDRSQVVIYAMKKGLIDIQDL